MSPRVTGGLESQQPLQLLGVEPDDHRAVHDDGRSGAALVVFHQLAQSLRILGDVLQLKPDAAGREKLPRRSAGGSTRLGVEDHLVRAHRLSFAAFPCLYHKRVEKASNRSL